VDRIFKAGEEDLPQGVPADGAVPGDRIGRAFASSAKGEQFLQLFGEHGEAFGKVAARRVEYLPEVRGQALMQSRASLRVDVDTEALQARGPGFIPLVYRCAYASLPQSLRQAEAPNAAADD
jgi:hypothetical protein